MSDTGQHPLAVGSLSWVLGRRRSLTFTADERIVLSAVGYPFP